MDLDRLRQDAAALLADGRARMVIGFRDRDGRPVPAFITDAEQAGQLVYDETCLVNPAAYLKRIELKRFRPVAVVARPHVMRSLILLAAETQIAADDVLVLAVGDDTYHGVLDLAGAAALLNETYADMPHDPEVMKRLDELSAMTPEERAAFWTEQFAKCTRCYACRAACPMCYCTQCIAEKNVPQWISTAAARHGNYAWNIIRAFHLAGRCTECGACEAACPQGIPLMLLNVSLARDVENAFGVKVGYDAEAEPVIGSWNADDGEGFIR
jgi:ferredoxin